MHTWYFLRSFGMQSDDSVIMFYRRFSKGWFGKRQFMRDDVITEVLSEYVVFRRYPLTNWKKSLKAYLLKRRALCVLTCPPSHIC